MNIEMAALEIPVIIIMLIAAFRAMSRAEITGRCTKPFVMPIFAGIAALILMAICIFDVVNAIRATKHIIFGMQLIITALSIAVYLLLMPHLRKRGPRA